MLIVYELRLVIKVLLAFCCLNNNIINIERLRGIYKFWGFCRMRRFNFGSAIIASIIATAIMTAFMFYFDMNVMLVLGNMAGMKGKVASYFIGGTIHLLIGIIYGLIYALIFEPLFQRLPKFVSGSLFSLLPFILALTMMGSFENLIRSVFKNQNAKYVDLCAPSQTGQNNSAPKSAPVDDVSLPKKGAKPPPTAPSKREGEPIKKERAAPSKSVRPMEVSHITIPLMNRTMSHPKAQFRETVASTDYLDPVSNMPAKTDEPAVVKEAESKLPSWLWSLINHVIYGFFLGVIYMPRRRRERHHHD